MRFSPENDVANKDLVLLALYEAGGAQKFVSTEHVAAKVFEYPLGRQRYRWEHFEQYPDKERVARELRRMKDAGREILVEGHVNVGAKKDRRDGWRLTPAGVERTKTFDEIVGAGPRDAGGGFVYDIEKIRRRVADAACYRQYLTDPSLQGASEIDFTDLLYVLPDSSSSKVRSAFAQLMAEVKATGADDLVEFLEAVGRRFSSFFGPQGKGA